MLFGAAAGGLVFGRVGDRFGRSLAMAGSILCFSLLSGVAYFSQTPAQLLVIWFLACLGVGGMWPNGVALVSGTWSNISRPMVAGVMGASANIGLFAMATLGYYVVITPEHWRWMLLVCATPAALGLFALFAVPESPRWLASRDAESESAGSDSDSWQVFRRPLLGTTLIGIVLATIPLVGGWGSANWMVPWAGEAGETTNPPNHQLKAQVHQARALPGMVGTFLGGWIAHLLGRRLSFFFCSLAALACAQWTFWMLQPTDPSFLIWVGALGFFSGIYFGWLPLFLPELFPTQVRSTGAGVSFNFGRFATAITVFATGAITAQFGGDYARIGRVTSLIFLVGAVAIWFAPDTSQRQLQD
jgi:MFS family permease